METRDRPERKRDPADVTVARPTFLLPHDLPATLAALTDEQMERLRTAVDTEVRRRAGDQPNTPAPVTPGGVQLFVRSGPTAPRCRRRS